MLFLEGGYYETSAELDQGPKYWWVNPPTDEDIQSMVSTLATRVIRFLKKKGYFNDESESGFPDEEMSQEELLPELQAASVQSRIAMGERKGQRVRRLGTLEWEGKAGELTGPLCATIAGFSLHAEIYCAPYDRAKLEKLCRYIARPAVSEERLKLTPSGDVILKLKTKYSDGTSHLLFSGLEFVEKLAALVPPPRIHLTRFHGVLAPHSKLRKHVVPKKEEDPTQDPVSITAEKPKRSKRKSWAELLARVFNIDMKSCPLCNGEFKIVAAIIETGAIKKILTHMGLPYEPPDIAPARFPSQMSFG
jgi:hypothetical protein